MLTEEIYSNSRQSPLVNNLQNLIDRHGFTIIELSKQSGIPYMTLVRLLDGSTCDPGVSLLDKLSRFFKVSSDSLLGIEDQFSKKNLNIVRITDPESPRIPLIKWEDIRYWSSQGFNYLNPDHQDWVACNRRISNSGFALRVRYEGCKVFPTNSIILIDPEQKYTTGDYVLASIKGNKPTIKQISEKGGIVYLFPLGGMVFAEKIELKNQILGTIVQNLIEYIK